MPSDPEGEPWSIYLGIHPEVGPVTRRSSVTAMSATPTTWTEITDARAASTACWVSPTPASATRPGTR